MLAKLLYSALLAVVAVAAFGELIRVWTDRRLYIGPFVYASNEGSSEDKGKAFGVQVGLAHSLIFRELQTYSARGAGGVVDSTYNIAPDEHLAELRNKLEDLALTYQNVDIGKLLGQVRKSLSQPNELSGAVTSFDGNTWVNVSWPSAPTINGKAETSFTVDSQSDETGIVRQVACGIAWAQIASKPTSLSASVANMGRSRFCQWADAIAVYSAAVAKRTEPPVPTIARLRLQLKEMQDAKIQYPDIYRLRADLTELLPAADRESLLVEAQEDRLTYALLTDPSIKSKPESERRMYALAMARPAIMMPIEMPEDLPANWHFVLAPHAANINRASAAVGAIMASGRPRATAFRVGRELIVTVDFALNRVERPANAESHSEAPDVDPRLEGLTFCAAVDASQACSSEQQFPITAAVTDGGPDSFIAVLRVDFNAGRINTLKLRDTELDARTLTDRYAYIIGYPHGESLVEPTLTQALLGDKRGIQRLLPGRTLALEAHPSLGKKAVMLATDINTSPGTAGAPLVDLVTGEVVGVHIGGRRKETGKLTFAEVIMPKLIEAIKAAEASAESPAGAPASAPSAGPAPGA